ncbi:hypothetical protein PM076_07100 [Halorubrum ezzemoulense]|jgi:hypothetical protein|uniref:Uncharacterized protein n=1 Tax=Halorubrum ezzemoulense TaxID=337243 RepID=A0A256JH06_HALEZ|nr:MULTISPECIES: hypothetical protein [Halorubrum]MDB2223516.1 hypothetical protein [Halorubrum ezzemoulense]MDB2240878.1 hypothetical protein [Halorubrum ezzemoulense]MDB2243243.1 hypothetical protein [Halorubrum ezzemoulense]MDB2251314.1 hypothetical protein [Halorubrum ezzemoulense]MDB2261605.1 hypothetical protein [Halorubrum ezzemoulense]
MDSSDRALLGVAGIVGALVLAVALAGGALFGFGESAARPLRLLAVEPLTWIVIAALLVAVVGNAYID